MGQDLGQASLDTARPDLMKSEAGVITVLHKYSIYFEYLKNDEATKTAIMVNGALATTMSFSPSVRNFKDHINIVLFDLPFAGRSRGHNKSDGVLTKDDEVEILLHLIECFDANYLISASWGGVSSLLSLARRPPTIEKAVICSFSPVINEAMCNYMTEARRFLCEQDIPGGAQLLNNTVGKYLPRLLKAHNYEYLLSMVQGNESQIMFHIDQIFELDQRQYVNRFANIDVPVLFVNGALDEYTTSEDVRLLAQYIRYSEFAVIPEAGHFLDLECTRTRLTSGRIMRTFFLGRDPVLQSMHAKEMAC
jgi:pimeloyl-ACP methyl ester carboxylesterase